MAGYSYATWGSPENAYAGLSDAFVAKLSNSGALSWNTFMGSADYDGAGDIAVDAKGNIYVAGYSDATWGTPENVFVGLSDGFIAKLSNSGVLSWNTFIGVALEYVNSRAITVDSSSNVYVAGSSSGTWGQPLNAFSGSFDAFTAKFDSSGALIWNTFMGSAIADMANAIVLDHRGNVCVAAYSSRTWGTPENAFVGLRDAFVAKMDNSGALLWHTFMGSAEDDSAIALAVDGRNNIYVAGWSDATWGTPLNAYPGTFVNGFAAKIFVDDAFPWTMFLPAITVQE